MKFSVIIPAYNEEQYIEKALQAILAQDYPDFEVIVVDNNSTDKTYEVANDFAEKLQSSGKLNVPIIVIKESQIGIMAACERGRSVAKGDVIARLDADCLPDRDWLVKAAKLFTNEKVVAVSGPYDFYDASRAFRVISDSHQRYLYSPVNIILQLLHMGAMTIGGNSMFRAVALEEIGGFDKTITFYGDDTNIARRIAKIGKVVFNRDLTMRTSARRFKKEGTIRTQSRYVYYFLKESFSRMK
jgi:glycosyltransferase involved in cell wall biosynthesis